MTEDLLNDISLLPRTRTVRGHSLVFDPQYYTMRVEIMSSEFTANYGDLSVKERADQLCAMAEMVFLPANPGWDAAKFFDKLDISALAAALRFFDRLRLGYEAADATTETTVETTSDESPETPKIPASIAQGTTKAARRQKIASQ